MIKLLMLTATLYANEKIYDQIINNNPNIDKKYAKKLSSYIDKLSREYSIPGNIYTAILAQESMYKMNVSSSTDFGISQVYYKTARRYNFNSKKLKTDLYFSLKAGAIILRDFKRLYAKKEQYWWARYNCGTKPNIKRLTCQKYIKKVKKYLK